MSPDVTGDVIAACAIAGLATLAAGAFAQVTTVVAQRRQDPDPAPVPVPDAAVWRACHHPACGHLETRHDPTPVGPVCRDCTERTEAS